VTVGRYFQISVSFALAMLAPAAFATPCDGIDRGLTPERSAALAATISRQLNSDKTVVLQSYTSDSWSIIYVGPQAADRVFLFFSGDPLTHHYVTMWSGAARRTEEQSIHAWVMRNAPGIPVGLAKCFAWHVTNDRDM